MLPAGETSFVGRQRQLETMEAALADVRGGHGRCVAVVGDPGIGKTRTVEEFARRSGVAAARVLFARCTDGEGAPPYWPWMHAIRRYADGRDDGVLRAELGHDAGLIAQIVPWLRTRLPDVGVPPDHGQASRFLLFESVAAFLRRATADDVLVLVFDDLHWADESTLQLLAFVARDLAGMRVLLIGTYRAREGRRLPHGLAEIGRLAHTLALPGFDIEEVEDLVERRLASTPPAGLVETLHARSEGNPFFLESLVRVVLEAGPGFDADRALVLPDDARAAIRHRLDAMSEDDRSLLGVAAVIGREFDLPLVQAASGIAGDAVLTTLTAAAAADIVLEDETLGRFRFAHALVRETLYGDLLPAMRARLHRQVGHALEAVGGADAEASLAELALHFFYATPLGEGPRAIDYCARAGASAVSRLAYGEAVAHYERALRAASLQPCAGAQRLDLLLALADAARRAGDTAKAGETYQRAARTAHGLGDVERLVRAALGAHRAADRYGTHAPVVSVLEKALAAVGGGDGPHTVGILAALAAERYFSGDGDGALVFSERAVAMARRLGDVRSLLPALAAHHMGLLSAEEMAERRALTQEMTALSAAGAGARHAGTVRVCRILDLLETGDVAAAGRELDRHVHDAEQSRIPHRLWHARVLQANLALLAGRFAEAEHLTSDALAIRRDGDDPAVMSVFFLATFHRRRELGRIADLEPVLRRYTHDEPGVIPWVALEILARFERGDQARAREQFEELAARDFADVRRDALCVAVLCALAEIVALLDDRARARLLYPRLAPYDGRNVIVHAFSVVSRGAAARYLGLLAATMGDGRLAERHLSDALAMNERIGARPQLAHTQYDLARVLLESAAPDAGERASTLLADAWRTAEELGMTPLLDRIAALRSSLPAPEPSRAADGPDLGPAVAVLRPDGDSWTIAYGGVSARLKDSKGLVYLRTLLGDPGREFHVLDLAAAAQSGAGAAAQAAAQVREPGDGGQHLDASARAAYKRRLTDLRDELEEARRFNDPGRAERAESEIEFLAGELARAVGLGGRKVEAAAERARVNLSRTIGAVVKKIAQVNPALGQLLSASVRTGTFCSYSPDPRLPVRWEL